MFDIKIRSTNFLIKRYKNVQLLVDTEQKYPCLKLMCKNKNKLINISKACKVFNVYSKKKIACKLFLVKKVIRISCLNREEMKILERKINDLLLDHHEFPNTHKSREMDITEHDLEINIYELNAFTLDNKNMDYYESIFQMDYIIPNYDENNQAIENFNKIGFDLPGNIDINLLQNAIEFLELRQQILHPGGVIVKIDKTTFSVKDFDKHLWISKVKINNEKLHFGDRIIKIFDKQINTESEFHENIKENCCHLTIQRLSNAKVFIYDKTKLKDVTFQLVKKKYFLFKHENLSDENWVITELNGFDALNLSKNSSKLNSLINSNPAFLSIIIHPEEFVKSLTE